MKKEVEKTENRNEDSSLIGENEPSVHSADNIEKPVQVGGKSQSICLNNLLSVLCNQMSLAMLHTVLQCHLGVKYLV